MVLASFFGLLLLFTMFGLIVIPNTGRRNILNILTDDTVGSEGPYDGAVVRLFKNDIEPHAGMLLADLTEADFSGYAASSEIVWGPAFTNSANEAVVVGDTKQFNHSGGATANTVYGYYVTNTAGTVLHFAERRNPVETMSKSGDAVLVVPKFSFGQ